MKKKRILIVGISVVLIAVIAVIGMRLLGGGSHTGIDNNPEAEVSGNSKVLVAYFSWSGNGQQMAGWISEETGGELFRIVSEESYGEDYEAHLYEQDIEMMAKTGYNAYRFSIEWARIEPQEDVYDENEVPDQFLSVCSFFQQITHHC